MGASRERDKQKAKEANAYEQHLKELADAASAGAAVRPGDSLHARVEVTGLRASRSRPERGFLDMTVTTLNADGAPLITQHWSLVLPTRTAPV